MAGSAPPGGFSPPNGGPPVANNDSYSLNHDSTLSVPAVLGVLANDTDPNGQTLSAVLVSQPTHGTLSLASTGAFVYTVHPGYTGTDTFTYFATDSSQQSQPATVTLTVGNTAPTTQPDSYSVHQGKRCR